MPLYEYRCPVCEEVDELFRPCDQRDDPVYHSGCPGDYPIKDENGRILELFWPLMERIYSGQTYKPGRHKKNPPYPIPKWT